MPHIPACKRGAQRLQWFCRARRGVSGALYLQSARAGHNSRSEARACGVWNRQGALMAGSRAIGGREPCQVLTEAALSGFADVPREGLAGATCLKYRPEARRSKNGCAANKKSLKKAFFVLSCAKRSKQSDSLPACGRHTYSSALTMLPSAAFLRTLSMPLSALGFAL